MAYIVSITLRAERDLADLYEEINAEDSAAAIKWYRGLKKGILSLSETAEPVPGDTTKISGTCCTATNLTSIARSSVSSRD